MLACCLPSLAVATDIRCQRSTSLDVPAERLTVDVVDLVRESTPEEKDTDLAREFSLEPEPSTPDLSSRARSLAILREIFGEPITDDDAFDVGLTAPPVAAGDESLNPGTVRLPAAGMPDSAPPSPGMSVDDSRTAPNADTSLPGTSDQETLRYRREMYRTDI